MKIFRDCSDNIDDLNDFQKKIEEDDFQLKIYFDKCSHRDFISALIKIGVLFDIIGDYINFLNPELKKAIEENDEKKRDRKINKFLNDLNRRINTEYDFDQDTFIVEEGVLYDGEIFLFVRKYDFIRKFNQ